jgi:hypothetical protein
MEGTWEPRSTQDFAKGCPEKSSEDAIKENVILVFSMMDKGQRPSPEPLLF